MSSMTAQAKPSSTDVQFKHVLVPLDGSNFGLAAIPTARALAERFNAELRTISVASNEDRAGRLLTVGAAALGADIGEGRAEVITGGDPAEVIARRAEELGSCLVCLSTHGRGRLTGAVFGSVARSVMQRSDSAIVALGPSADRPGWSPRPGWWPAPLSVNRIVACVDGSEASEDVLPAASDWARRLGMSLTILTVVEDAPEPTRRHANRYGPTGDAESYVEDLVRRWQELARDVNGLIIRDPIGPASGIRTYLAQQPAGLVAVRTHARSGLQRLLRGATAASIVHASVAPCLVVHK
jgi:nucleotide-binding universal stress UspA family protein